LERNEMTDRMEMEASPGSRLPRSSSERILLIDDDREILELLAEWLSGKGHEVHALADGSQAVQAALSFRPAVVILDRVLRGITGATIAHKLREENIGCRIIFLSGLSRAELPAEEMVLEKPIDLHLLEEAITATG
jgi:DNA-binding response OmpR family regulator